METLNDAENDAKLSKVVRQISKLMRLAESSNPNEAASAATKAQQMLLAHKLSMSDIGKAATEDADPMAEEFGVTSEKRIDAWKHALAAGVARAFMCRSMHWKRDGQPHKIAFLGRQNDVQVAWYMYGYTSNVIDSMVAKSFKAEYERLIFEDYPQIAMAMNKRSWGADFRHGAMETVIERLKQNKAKFEASHEECRAMVRVSSAEVNEFLEKKYPKSKPCRRTTKTLKSESAYLTGREAGRNINLNVRGLTGAAEKDARALPEPHTGGMAQYARENVEPRMRNLELD